MIMPDIFCTHCKVIFDGFEQYQEHVEETTSSEEDYD